MAFTGMFSIVFIGIAGIIVFTIIKGIAQWGYNNTQPVLSVTAKVSAKRAHSSHHNAMNHHMRHNDTVNNHMHHSTSTTYYVTFEVESGDRMELRVPAHEYGMFAEEDFGNLTFQGTRYLSFQRQL